MLVGCTPSETQVTIKDVETPADETAEESEPEDVEEPDEDVAAEPEEDNVSEDVVDEGIGTNETEDSSSVNESSEEPDGGVEINGTQVTDEEEEESSDESEDSEDVQVIKIEDLKFVPNDVTIKAGTKVRWVHDDLYAGNEKIKHIVRVYPKQGQTLKDTISKGLFYGDTFEIIFEEPGDYYYIDVVYSTQMRGDIVVE